AYPILNTASWNWPEMLGGGYHFLQFDGMYNVDTPDPLPFNYHNGTARIEDGLFEQNFATITLDTPITITTKTTIEVKMNIAELFTNPNTWDLNVLDTPLMPNYDAQKMMQENILSVFTIGEITQ
ncbi:MAG: MbnP family protein, partial [Olleya sp.]